MNIRRNRPFQLVDACLFEPLCIGVIDLKNCHTSCKYKNPACSKNGDFLKQTGCVISGTYSGCRAQHDKPAVCWRETAGTTYGIYNDLAHMRIHGNLRSLSNQFTWWVNRIISHAEMLVNPFLEKYSASVFMVQLTCNTAISAWSVTMRAAPLSP